MASGAECVYRNERVSCCMRDAREASAAAPSAILQIGDTYRLERARGAVLWDVVWIGPLNRMFTRLRIQSSNASPSPFGLVHWAVKTVRLADLEPCRFRFAGQSDYLLHGELPLHKDSCVALLAALRIAHVAVLGADQSSAWSLSYDVRFEPDQLERSVRVVERFALAEPGPYR